MNKTLDLMLAIPGVTIATCSAVCIVIITAKLLALVLL